MDENVDCTDLYVIYFFQASLISELARQAGLQCEPEEFLYRWLHPALTRLFGDQPCVPTLEAQVKAALAQQRKTLLCSAFSPK